MEIKNLFFYSKSRLIHISIVFTIAVLMVFTSQSSALYADDTDDLILVLRPEGIAFSDVSTVISDELEDEIKVVGTTIPGNISEKEFADILSAHAAQLVVLMDNRTIGMYKRYQASLPETAKIIPSISCMGIYVSKAISGIKNATGISYEVPIVTSIVNLRALTDKKIRKAGIIHREFMKNLFFWDIEFCRRENIEIFTRSVSDDESDSLNAVKKELKHLIFDEKIDVLWIPNDNALLKPDIIKNVWVPMIKRYKLPIIVGVEILVNPQINLGTFAVLPDHEGIGRQVAELVLDIRENHWDSGNRRPAPPLAVYKIINMRLAEKLFQIRPKHLETVDKILK